MLFALCLLVLVPIVELYVIVEVAGQIGALATFFLLVTLTLGGVWLVKREGLTVARRVQDQLNRSGEEYGTARLFKVLKKSADLPTRELIQVIFSDIDQHTDGGPMSDDQSLIAMRVG